MRRALMVTTFLVGLNGAAQAQWMVACVTCEDKIEATVRWGQQAIDMASQIQGGVQRLQQLRATYAALTRITDLGSAVSGLNALGIRVPLPVDPYTVQGLLSGRASGGLGGLNSLLSAIRGGNRVYDPQGGGWTAQEIVRNGDSIANAQTMAMGLYEASQRRMELLPELQARIDTAQDPSEREALIARLAAEQTYIQNATVQAQTLTAYMQSQIQLMTQRREERLQESIEASIEEALAGTGVSPGGPPLNIAAAW